MRPAVSLLTSAPALAPASGRSASVSFPCSAFFSRSTAAGRRSSGMCLTAASVLAGPGTAGPPPAPDAAATQATTATSKSGAVLCTAALSPCALCLGSRHGQLPAHHGSNHRPRAEPRVLRGARVQLRGQLRHRPERRARGDELLLLDRR